MKQVVSLLLVVPILALVGCGPGGAPDDEDPVVINIIETTASVEVGHTLQFHYSVSNSTNTACSWRVNDVAGGNATVGTIGADGLYTAPAAVPNPSQVTVKAVASADATKSDTAAVTITAPPPFTVSPPTATVPAGGTQPFTTTMDVTWSLEGASGNTASLGAIASDGIYTAPLSPPLGGEVTIVATATSDTSLHATAVATIPFSNASLQGHYAFSYRATDAGEMMFVGGCFTADGQGGISAGNIDMNSQIRGGIYSDGAAFTGAYQVQADGRASLQMNVGAETFTFRLVLVSDTSARMMAFETGRTGVGVLERQDPSSFAAGLSGAYVFIYDGMGHIYGTAPPSGQPVAAAGRFSIQGATIGEVVGDINLNGVWQAGGMGSASVSGNITPSGSVAGMGRIALDGTSGPQIFRYYMISTDAALLVSLDWGSMFPKLGVIGSLMRQGPGPFSDASLSGDVMSYSYALAAIPTPRPDPYVPPWTAYAEGIYAAGGNGALTGGTVDNNVNGTLGGPYTISGPYEISSNGRGGMNLIAGGSENPGAFYMLADNTAYAVGLGSWGTGVSLLSPRSGDGPYSAASVNGHYALSLSGTLADMSADVTGQILLNGQGALAGAIDVNYWGTLSGNVPVTGSYSVDAAGRGTVTINSQVDILTAIIYIESPGNVLLMGTGYPAIGRMVRQY